MLDNRHNSSCPREDQIVSYLYREMSPADVDRFEAHLAECGACVDEFAAVSEPHLAVYEWRTDVFDRIPAPDITIPILEEQRPHAASLIGRLTALLSGWPAGLRVTAGFAALLIFGFSVSQFIGSSGSPDVARNAEMPRQIQAVESVEVNAPPRTVDFSSVADMSNDTDNSPESAKKAVRVKSHTTSPARPTVVRTGRSEFAANRKEKTTTQRSLRLNNLEEDEDTTLRLADLFEEVGSL